jgi:hypothetical protein
MGSACRDLPQIDNGSDLPAHLVRS